MTAYAPAVLRFPLSGKRVSRIAALLLGAAAWTAPAAWAEKPACDPSVPTVTLSKPAGQVCGVQRSAPGVDRKANAYLGIPFAKDVQRWKNPEPLPTPPWSGVYNATEFGPICPQAKPAAPATTNCGEGSSCGTVTTHPVPDLPQDEHKCLNLNVFVPPGTAADARLPVMEYIYGGAFLDGSNALPYYDGTYLAAKYQAIVVVVNYRLGILGGLFMKDITDSTHNNFGFRDQMLALRWVHDNIAGFGGDPANITLFGESAGAMSIGLHALPTTPSHDTFAKAIMQSNELGLPYKNKEVAESVGRHISEEVLASSGQACGADCMRGKTVEELIAAQSSTKLSSWAALTLSLEGLTLWSPVLDGTLLKSQPVDAKIDKPLILGSLKDEGPLFAAIAAKALTPFGPLKYGVLIDSLLGVGTSLKLPAKYKCPLTAKDCTSRMSDVFTDFLFTCPNRHYAKEAADPGKVYMYFITQVPGYACYSPVACICGGLACHGTEIPFNFHTPQAVKPDYQFSAPEETLAASMQGFWYNFAATGNPNAAGASTWPPFGADKTYHILNADNLNDNPKDPYLASAHCAFWDPYYSAAGQKAMLQRMEERLAHPETPKSPGVRKQ